MALASMSGLARSSMDCLTLGTGKRLRTPFRQASKSPVEHLSQIRLASHKSTPWTGRLISIPNLLGIDLGYLKLQAGAWIQKYGKQNAKLKWGYGKELYGRSSMSDGSGKNCWPYSVFNGISFAHEIPTWRVWYGNGMGGKWYVKREDPT